MNFTRRVMFGDEEVAELAYLDTTGISGLVPAAAYTAELTVETNAGVLTLGDQYIILDSDSQVLVSGLESDDVSGKAGELINLSGENFYQITDVKFGSASGNFSIISESEIDVLVPENAEYAGVSVLSTLRTGAAGSTSESSGITYNKFVSIPEVAALSSGQLNSGEALSISGRSFNSVTGVTVNDISFTSFSVENSTGINVIVPGGEVRGVPQLQLQSGEVFSAPNNILFKPLAKITGVNRALTGSLVTISGTNFSEDIIYSTGGELVASYGGVTGAVGVQSPEKITGEVPSGIDISISGGNVAGGEPPIISPVSLNLYSKDYPELYPSEFDFTPLIGQPQITTVSIDNGQPASGIAGDVLEISGFNLYGITGATLVTDTSTVGIGTAAVSSIMGGSDNGRSVLFRVASASAPPTTGHFYNIEISGHYGNVGIDRAFYAIGNPTISSITPSTNIEPGSAGTLVGTHLYTGTTIRLQNNNAAPANLVGYLNVSGYSADHTTGHFTYPDSFQTGINYKVYVKNRRGTVNSAITPYYAPQIDTITPSTGVFGDRILISGYFEPIKDLSGQSGMSVGQTVVSNYTQDGTTGVYFDIPAGAISDIININTSGGAISSTGLLGVVPRKPAISGYFEGGGDAPSSFNQDQVFSEYNVMTITGSRMNLVTGISFSGLSESITINQFQSKSFDNIIFKVPQGINSGSGDFFMEDFRGRRTASPYPVNITRLSGYTDYLLPGETMSLSGENLTGLFANFTDLNNEQLGIQALTNAENTPVGGIDTITLQTPTGILNGEFFLSGRSNSYAAPSTGNGLFPLPAVSGVSGANAGNEITTGSNMLITGFNAGGIEQISSGDTAVGITGTGNKDGLEQVYFYKTIEDMTTGYDSSVWHNVINFQLDSGFVGTGRFFLSSPAIPFDDAQVRRQANYYSTQYIINGTRVNATGYGPQRGITGVDVTVTGFGFGAVTGAFFKIPEGPYLSADFTKNSNNKITTTVPKEAIEARGETNIILSGGTNQDVGKFEVILDTSTVKFNIVDESDQPGDASRVSNYTVREVIGGQTFLVTRTKFPDGTTAVVSSVPEG